MPRPLLWVPLTLRTQGRATTRQRHYVLESSTACSVCVPHSLYPLHLFTSHLPACLMASISTFPACPHWVSLLLGGSLGLHLAPQGIHDAGLWLAPTLQEACFFSVFLHPPPTKSLLPCFVFLSHFLSQTSQLATAPRLPGRPVGEEGGDRTFVKCLPPTGDKLCLSQFEALMATADTGFSRARAHSERRADAEFEPTPPLIPPNKLFAVYNPFRFS